MAKKKNSKPAPAGPGAEVVKPAVTPAVPETLPEGVQRVGDESSNQGVRFACKKHGDITNATLHMTFAGPNGEKQGQYLYCLHCLNEVLLSLQKGGAIETVQIVVPDEVAKQMKANQEAAAAKQPAPETPADILSKMANPEQ